MSKSGKRGDPLSFEFESYTPAEPEKDKDKKGSLLMTLLVLENPLMLVLFPSVRRSVRDYLNRD